MSLNIFDTYNLRARVCVSIFYAAPFIFDILCLSHETLSLAEGIILSAVCVTVCQALLGIHRSPIEKRSTQNTAAELLSPSSALSSGTRARYYRKLASLEPEFQPLLSCIDPNTKGQPCDVDRLCADVIPWLRAKTREPTTFRLVYEENINYGYIRNMLRLKPVGLGTNIVAIIFFGINIIANISTFTWNEQRAFFLCVAIHLLVVLYLHLCINDSAVNAAAKRYAYALLETIDSL